MLWRYLFGIFMILGTGALAVAQSYQTDFAATKVDRGRSPATMHGGVNVDAAGGAVDVSIPLGPGIGLRGLHFTPTLRGRWSPQWSGGVQPVGVAPYISSDGTVFYDRTARFYYNQINGSKAGGFDGSMFGGLVLTVDNGDFVNGNDDYYTPPRILDEVVARFALPDGRMESLHPATPDASNIPAPTEVRGLLTAFGYGASWVVAYDTHQAAYELQTPGFDSSSVKPFVHFGTNGSLVVGIWDGGATAEGRAFGVHAGFIHNAPPAAYAGWPITSFSTMDPTDEVLPPRILVIQGEVAYEYVFDAPYFTQAIDVWGRGFKSASKAEWLHFLVGVNYRMNRMLNRVGDSIQFPTSLANTVTWIPGDGGLGASIQMGNNIRYSGGNEAFAFDLLPGTTNNYPWLSTSFPEDNILQRYNLYGGVQNLGTGEEVRFSYIDLVPPSFGGASPAVATSYESVLGSIDFPGKRVSLGWEHQTYAHNASWDVYLDHSLMADGAGNLSGNHFPHWSGGVTSVTETDLATSSARVTAHTRQVPQPNLAPSAPFWSSTTFYDLVTHPDGSATVTGYVEPAADETYSLPATNEGKMRRLAYLKHQAREIREYAAPVENQAPDYALTDFLGTRTTPTQSLAHTITFTDRWDLHGIANPNAQFSETAVPHPTRTRIWNKDAGTVTIREVSVWDQANRDYTTTHTWTTQDASGLATTDYLAVAYNTPGTAPPDPASVARKEVEQRTLGSNQSKWYWSRTLSATRQVDLDSTGGVAPGFSYPFFDAGETKVYDDELNLITLAGRGPAGGYETSVTFTFGTTGAARMQIQSALVSGSKPGGALINSGSAGANYHWDASTGYLSRITPKGVSWSHQETRDAFGLVQTQTDPNNKVTTFTWDSGGRLVGIQPPDGMQGTVITPDADNLGMSVTRGLEATRYRFNGFGELILEQRSLDGGSSWTSHRNFGYDPAGRRTGVTVWYAGPGVETEWVQPNLVKSATVQTLVSPGYYTYDCLGELDANGNCIGRVIKLWTPPEYSSQNLQAIYSGTSTVYDARGRVSQVVQPTNPAIITQHAYSGLSHTVTVGAASTTFTADLAGRLNRVTDALNQVTTYRYDPLGRIAQVQQQEGATAQVRGWAYNGLGWLTTLQQPESGTTTYSDFTVAGTPTATTYGVGTGAPLSVTTTVDALNRPVSVTAGNGSVSQAFVYDQGTAQNASNSKVLQGTDGGVVLNYTYGGLGGALSDLNTTIWSGGAVGAGESRAFPQSYAYDLYGNRTGGHTGRSAWSGPFDQARSMPYSLSYGGLSLLTKATYDAVSWTLNRMEFGNGTATGFSYETDQQRLATQTHWPVSGGALAAWSYGYDERGNLVSSVNASTAKVDQYGYDNLNRLTAVTANAKVSGTWSQYAQTFTYDAFGNRTSAHTGQIVPDGTGGSYLSYSSLPKQIQNVDLAGTASLAQRNQLPGSTATGAGTGASYDVYGNLARIWTSIADPSTQVSLTYDALGRVKTLTRQDGTVERYGYTPQGLRCFVEEVSGGLLMKRRYNIYNDLRQLVSQYELVLE